MSESATTTTTHLILNSQPAQLDVKQAIALIEQSQLFDRLFYLQSYPGIASMHEDPLVHYITRGSSMGYEPNALFDSNHYRQYYAASGLLAHMPLLSANPLLHFITTGSAEGIEANAVFDTSYYLNRYPDVKNLGITALAHYLKEGAVQGRDPSAHFSTSFYLEQYPDVKAAGMNPLAHYIRHGAAEGRNPSPTFNTSFYLSQNADVRASSINPLAHYETYGICEGRAPLPQTAELAAAIESISEHYLLARQIEPALPPLSSLASLQAGCLPKSSRTGAAYFKMAAALTRPFTHLFLLSGRGWDKAAELALRFCDAIVKRSGPDSVLLICTDGRDPSIRQRIPDEVRIVYFEELERRLDERARLTLLTRLALQAAPHVLHNFESRIGWLALRKYHRQLKTCCRKLYAYVPPIELDEEQVPVGRIVDDLNPCIDHLDGVVLDDDRQCLDICNRLGLEKRNREKLIAVGDKFFEQGNLSQYW